MSGLSAVSCSLFAQGNPPQPSGKLHAKSFTFDDPKTVRSVTEFLEHEGLQKRYSWAPRNLDPSFFLQRFADLQEMPPLTPEARERWHRDQILRRIFQDDGKPSNQAMMGNGFDGEYKIFSPPARMEDVFDWLKVNTDLDLSPAVLGNLNAQRLAAAQAIIAYMKAQYPGHSLYIPAAGPEQRIEIKAAQILEIQVMLPKGPMNKWKHPMARIEFKLVDFYRGSVRPSLVTFTDFVGLHVGDSCPDDLAAASVLLRSRVVNPEPLDLK